MRRRHSVAALTFFVGMAALSACRARPVGGGGQANIPLPGTPAGASERRIDSGDVALPAGYQIEAVARGLTFPVAVAFDEDGRVYVLQAGYSYGEVFSEARLLRLEESGAMTEIARSDNPPWNGMVFHDGAFYVAEGGVLEGGRILKVTPEGIVTRLVSGLPSLGDHHTDGPAIGPDGWLYFGQGTATNSAVVGPDNADFGWLERFPEFRDIPCEDVTLLGVNFKTENVLTEEDGDEAVTGAYLPFGTPSSEGQVIAGGVPCGGSVMRIPLEGGIPELVAWGFRNPFGLAFSPEGALYVSDNGYDLRGSRPVWGAPDLLWKVEPGTWYGWPDFSGGRPLDDDRYKKLQQRAPPRLLAEHPNEPPRAAAFFGVHSSSNGMDFSRNAAFGYSGDLFVAQFGDMAPNVGKVYAPVGFQVVRVNVEDGVIEPFAVNRGAQNGPASKLKRGGLERPVAVRFDPAGTSLYVVDFGVMGVTEDGPKPVAGTGVLWKISAAGVASK